MNTIEFRRAVLDGRTDFTGEDLSDVDFGDLHFWAPKLRRSRWPGIKLGQTPEQRAAAIELRRKVADRIEQHPELHRQSSFGLVCDFVTDRLVIPPPDCGTASCVAGWAARFASPEIREGRDVADIGFRALWCDGLPMPSFEFKAKREKILADLRAR